MLGVKNSMQPHDGRPYLHATVDLACSIEDILAGIDLVFVSHLHPDHFDQAAFGLVPRHVEIVCRPGDGDVLRNAGFLAVHELDQPMTRHGVRMTPTPGTHGTDAVAARLGGVIGVLLEAKDEPTIYWAGDTILYPPVFEVIERTRPDVIVTHSGGATASGVAIIMDPAQTIDVALAAPDAHVVAVHLEAFSICATTRQQVREAANAANVVPERLHIPHDNETLTFNRRTG